MKKTILFILVWFATSLFIFGQDLTAPEVKSVTFSTDTLRGTDTLEVIMVITDDQSNSLYVNMVLNASGGSKVYLLNDDWIRLNDSTLKRILPITDYFWFNDLVYKIELINVQDDSGNIREYGENDFDNKVVIHSVVNDRDAPEVTSVTFSTDTLKGYDSLGITVTVADNISRVGVIHMYLSTAEGNKVYALNNDWVQVNDSTFRIFLPMTENFFYNDYVYEIERIYIQDSPNGNGKNYGENEFDNKIVIHSVVNDREAPEIKSVTFSTDTLKGDDTLGITVVATDNMAGVGLIKLNLANQKGFHDVRVSFSEDDWIRLNDSTFFLPMKEYFFYSNVYEMEYILIRDDSPNNNEIYDERNRFDNTVVVSRNITGISSNKEDNFTFYPNPTHSTLTINSKNNVSNEIQIIDQYGEIVKSVEVNSLEATTIDVSGIQTGVYFLKQGQQSSKFVIQK